YLMRSSRRWTTAVSNTCPVETASGWEFRAFLPFPVLDNGFRVTYNSTCQKRPPHSDAANLPTLLLGRPRCSGLRVYGAGPPRSLAADINLQGPLARIRAAVARVWLQ